MAHRLIPLKHRRRSWLLLASAALALAVARPAQAAATTDPRVGDRGRAGAMRIALAPSAFSTRDTATGEGRGPGADLGRELAARLGLPLRLDDTPTTNVVISNLFKPFVVSLFVEEEDDFVDFAGLANVVVQACLTDSASPVDPCHFHANLQNVVGTGPSGDEYRLDGAFNQQAAIVAGGEYEFTGLFRLSPVDPCRRAAPTDPCQRPVSLLFGVTVNENGTVDEEDVSIALAPPGDNEQE